MLPFLLAVLARSRKAIVGAAGSGAVAALALLDPRLSAAAAVALGALIYVMPNADLNGDGRVDADELGRAVAGAVLDNLPGLVEGYLAERETPTVAGETDAATDAFPTAA